MNAPGPYRLRVTPDAVPVEFRFDGQIVCGVMGDTVASALLANGFRVVSRSFKFHRPRGIFSAGYEEPNALVQLNSGVYSIPCARATLIPISSGLEVSSAAGWPSVSFDALRAIDFVHHIFAAGFYNKTFIWPSWHRYESTLRKLAGFGRVPTGCDPHRYETRHAHCDVLVIGGGCDGIEAIKTAVGNGQRLILAELEGLARCDLSSLSALENVRVLSHTTAVGIYDHNMVTLAETVLAGTDTRRPRERLWMIRARRVILATGAIEQPLIFSNNDRPGIMLAGAALKFLRQYSIAPGRHVVIATNNDSAYVTAGELKRGGANVLAMVDSREAPPEALLHEMKTLGVRVYLNSLPINTKGFTALKGVTIGRFESGTRLSKRVNLACDSLLVSGGWSPALHLFAQGGGHLKFSEHSRALEPTASHPCIKVVGSAAQPALGTVGERISPVGDTSRQWVDLKHDVTVSDIELSIRENFTTVEHIKRYTTLGMAVDQGKVGQAPGIEIIARGLGVRPSVLGHTTFRPPFVPVTLGTMVGRNIGELFAPFRRSPLYALQKSAGALFEDMGEWQRPAAFPRAGESREQAVIREVKHIRDGVGLFDASPLGKVELAGPDALEFANRFYINNLATLNEGRARYVIMLRETGAILDDGTAVALSKDRVLLTTTSGGASRVAAWLEEWHQCEWPELRVVVVPVTDQWATVALTGRHARSILQRLKPECDISNANFPHLGFRATKLLGADARIYRVSFSGELTYEINVSADRARELWEALLAEGRAVGIEPFGVDALLHLRMEKGFLHVGAETDGTTIPSDVGYGKLASSKPSHYIGKRSLSLLDNVRPDRLQLVGLTSIADPLPIGAHLRLDGSPDATDGWVTSAGALSTNGKPVALAMLRAGRDNMSQIVTVHDAGQVVSHARVVAPMFYDPNGERINA